MTATEEESMCGDKVKYTSRKEARKEGRNRYQLRFTGHRMEVYKCPFCSFFHIGHKIGNRLKDRIILFTN